MTEEREGEVTVAVGGEEKAKVEVEEGREGE